MKMYFLLTVLIATGALAVLGTLRPRSDVPTPVAQEIRVTTITLIWVLLPMISGWVCLKRTRQRLTRSLLQIYNGGLVFIWGLGAFVALSDEAFDGNLGLLFWPALEWIGLFVIFVVWSLNSIFCGR